MIGKTVSHYRVIDKLGQGAMGEVFLAEDSTLGRRVALKFLPEELSSENDMLSRFEREARLLASLNHPNLAIVHGLETFEGGRFIVMELVEGETLADKISRTALGVMEALAICRQIAEGLEVAHERGIVHRDLKPANVMVSSSGRVKILDFGLARPVVVEGTPGNSSQLSATTGDMTLPGTVLGTASYMSPEQAMGKPVDKRTDIWAFGCVLYECLTRQKAFPGKYMAEVMAAVLGRDPDWAALPSNTPGSIHTVLRRCLHKDPQSRLRDIGDARLEIDELGSSPVVAAPASRRFLRLAVVACAAVAVLAGFVFGPRIWISSPPAPVGSIVTSRIKIVPGHHLVGRSSGEELSRPSMIAFGFSGNGEFVIYSAVAEVDSGPQPQPQLFLRKLAQAEAVPIRGTDGGTTPFLSPDDRWVGFWADGAIRKVPVQGGVATVLCESQRLYGASWGLTGEVAFAEVDSGISVVSAEGGLPRALTVLDPQEEYAHYLPAWIPGGEQLLFTALKNFLDPRPSIGLFQVDSGEIRILLEDAADARYLPTGHLAFMRRGILMAVGFDRVKLEIVGQPVALVENVMQAFATNNWNHTTCGQFAFSQNGRLLYAEGGIIGDNKNQLVWVDQAGLELPATDGRFPYFTPRLSPDGKRIAYCALGRETSIWVYDLDSGIHSQLTRGGNEIWPVWTSDGRRIVFSKYEASGSSTYWQVFDGSAEMQRICETKDGVNARPASCSADGAYLAMRMKGGDSQSGISVLETNTGNLVPFLSGEFWFRYPEFSPDGRLIAYSTNESGQYEVYIQPFPGKEWKRQVSIEGGREPLWSKDGRQLFYRQNPGKVLVADIKYESEVIIGKPRVLFTNDEYEIGTPMGCWDISLDSKHFLMVKKERREPEPVRELTLVQNWFAEVKRLVPNSGPD